MTSQADQEYAEKYSAQQIEESEKKVPSHFVQLIQTKEGTVLGLTNYGQILALVGSLEQGEDGRLKRNGFQWELLKLDENKPLIK